MEKYTIDQLARMNYEKMFLKGEISLETRNKVDDYICRIWRERYSKPIYSLHDLNLQMLHK